VLWSATIRSTRLTAWSRPATSRPPAHSYRNALQRIDAPTLVVHGEANLQPVQASRVYAELIPGAQLSVLPSARHAPYHTHPEAVAQAVGPFLTAAEPGSEAP